MTNFFSELIFDKSLLDKLTLSELLNFVHTSGIEESDDMKIFARDENDRERKELRSNLIDRIHS